MFQHRKYRNLFVVALIAFITTVTSYDSVNAGLKDTTAEEATCKDIGFSPKTVSFADCVIELLGRKEAGTGGASVSNSSSTASKSKSLPQATLSPNEQTCVGYGFKKQTTQFGQCLMQLDDAQRQAQFQQQQYELQLAQYQQQVASYNAQQAAIKREKNRRQGEALMRMSQGVLNSRSPSLLGNIADGFAAANGTPIPQPVPPMPPILQNYTVRMPSGNQVYCNYNSALGYMSCR